MTGTFRIYGRLCLALALGIFALVLVRTAWVNDDAYITLRVVDNALSGYGLRWNVDERVQAYTHPLWFFLLLWVIDIANEYFYAILALSISLSFCVVAVAALRIASGYVAGVLLVAAAVSSRAFVDFSTSGLENPLTHLILLLFFSVLVLCGESRRTTFVLALLAALGALTRPDVLLFFLPALVYRVARAGVRASALPIALGLAPLAAWHLFTLFYYGAIVPNTAIAKLDVGIDRGELLAQGGRYFLNSLRYDPMTLPTIALAAGVAVWRREPRSLVMMAGAALYLAYVLYIGGDFMSGRFFAAPFFAALLVLARAPAHARSPAPYGLALLIVLAGGVAHPQPAYLTGADFGADREEIFQGHGIADERRFYHRGTGLIRDGGGRGPENGWTAIGERLAREEPEEAKAFPSVGFIGFYAGPEVTIVDKNALTDPFLSRIPIDSDGDWRIGHFTREIPEGYLEWRSTGDTGALADEGVARYVEAIADVTRGPIFEGSRLRTVLDMHVGRYQRTIE